MKNVFILFFCILEVNLSFAQIQVDKPIQLTGSGTDAKIEGIQDVTNPTDAANKAYVDSQIGSLGGGNVQFTFSASTSSVAVPLGNVSSAIRLNATYTSGTPSIVDIEVTGTPANVYSRVISSSGTPNFYSELFFDVGLTATPGAYPIVVTARGGASPQVLNITLNVLAGKKVFVSSTTYTGATMGGVAGANTKCQTLASAAGLTGTFKAWLSSNSSSPSSSFTQASGSYVLVNNTVIANNWADLTDGTLAAAISTNEYGNNVGSVRVWTQTYTNGTFNSGNCSNACTNWSNNTGDAQWGQAGSATSTWTQIDNSGGGISCGGAHQCNPCSCSYNIYCFEQ